MRRATSSLWSSKSWIVISCMVRRFFAICCAISCGSTMASEPAGSWLTKSTTSPWMRGPSPIAIMGTRLWKERVPKRPRPGLSSAEDSPHHSDLPRER